MRKFLFLQGPHGPFFWDLSRKLREVGFQTMRIGFNGGDALFWHDKTSFIPYLGKLEDWRDWLGQYLADTDVTDVVIYGDTRAIHTIAREEAMLRGITLHFFEEGYLRPYWVTYERGGVNGHSRLMQMSVAQMQAARDQTSAEPMESPAEWGALWRHTVLGGLYHAAVMLGARRYRGYVPHRSISVGREWLLNLRRLLVMPVDGLQRRLATLTLQRSGAPYHLVLLQLAHDASFREHSDFERQSDFIDLCCAEFAKGAAAHHHLVFKTHPLEDGRENVTTMIRRSIIAHNLKGRVHVIRGGKLGPLMDRARSVVTVNSTAGQQALWRGLPLKIFGRAVYAKPEFVSSQPLAAFFAQPSAPDASAYRDYREFLLETSQITGGFYTRAGRAQILRRITDVLLADLDPYERHYRERVANAPALRIVRAHTD